MSRRLILASGSPRRSELLGLLGVPFEVVPSNADETPRPGESPREFVARAALDKGTEVSERVPDAVVLAADTIVSIDEQILGKPSDIDDAVRMLELLSGRSHWVLTAVSVTDSASGSQDEGLEETRVWFNPIDRATIVDVTGLPVAEEQAVRKLTDKGFLGQGRE